VLLTSAFLSHCIAQNCPDISNCPKIGTLCAPGVLCGVQNGAKIIVYEQGAVSNAASQIDGVLKGDTKIPGSTITYTTTPVADGTYSWAYDAKNGFQVTQNGAPVNGTVLNPLYFIFSGNAAVGGGCDANAMACTGEQNAPGSGVPGTSNYAGGNVTLSVTIISNNPLNYWYTNSVTQAQAGIPNPSANLFDPSNLVLIPHVEANESGHAVFELNDVLTLANNSMMGPGGSKTPTSPTPCDEAYIMLYSGFGQDPSCPLPAAPTPTGGGGTTVASEYNPDAPEPQPDQNGSGTIVTFNCVPTGSFTYDNCGDVLSANQTCTTYYSDGSSASSPSTINYPVPPTCYDAGDPPCVGATWDGTEWNTASCQSCGDTAPEGCVNGTCDPTTAAWTCEEEETCSGSAPCAGASCTADGSWDTSQCCDPTEDPCCGPLNSETLLSGECRQQSLLFSK